MSSTAAIRVMERLAKRVLPVGFSYDWTDLSFQEVNGNQAGLYVFPLCVLFVFLVLAAQYGSWTLPLAVILIVPMCLLSATLGVRIMGQDVNVLTQIGFVVLVGLAAKNAILIVEFARDIEQQGRDRLEAVIEACQLRLRPILMTSFAFILGVLPLAVSIGSGSEMRRAVGVAVFFGMLGVTLFGLIFTPVFYMLIRRLFPGSVRLNSEMARTKKKPVRPATLRRLLLPCKCGRRFSRVPANPTPATLTRTGRAMNQLVTLPAANNGKMLRHIFAALSASLISVGIARFAYTPLLPVLIEARWLSVSAAVYLSAAGLAGYLVGALLGRRLGARFSNVVVLRAMNIVAVASLAACAFPVAEWWFFVWRLAAGISGGATVVLVGATVLPHVPAHRRGIASGAIFLGIGLGILASGTVVPALLDYGLQAAWLGLAAFATVLTAATWNAWPTSLPAANAQAKAAIPEAHPHVAILYVEFGLMALAPVAAMLFLVDFVSRELNAGTHIGSTFWIVYGVGAIIGPPAYGYLIDRFGAIVAVRWIFVVQCVCLVWLSYANDLTSDRIHFADAGHVHGRRRAAGAGLVARGDPRRRGQAEQSLERGDGRIRRSPSYRRLRLFGDPCGERRLLP